MQIKVIYAEIWGYIRANLFNFCKTDLFLCCCKIKNTDIHVSQKMSSNGSSYPPPASINVMFLWNVSIKRKSTLGFQCDRRIQEHYWFGTVMQVQLLTEMFCSCKKLKSLKSIWALFSFFSLIWAPRMTFTDFYFELISKVFFFGSILLGNESWISVNSATNKKCASHNDLPLPSGADDPKF